MDRLPARSQEPSSYRVPTLFEPNAGRADSEARFITRVQGRTVLLGDRDTRVVLDDGATVTTRLLGARERPVAGEQTAAARLNVATGHDRSAWTRGAPLFGSVAQRGVYPGIDLVHHGDNGSLEYDFRLAPGADPARIAMAVDGASLALDRSGNLQLNSFGGTLVHQRPIAYQEIDGRQVAVDARFRVRGGRVGFDVGRYDRSKPLVIDPILSYSTFFGSSGNDRAQAIAAGSDGSAYVGGMAEALDLPGHASETGAGEDAYVAKFAPNGSLSYLTYLIANGADEVTGLGVDGSGNAFAAGWTTSSNFPSNEQYGADSNSKDAFVVKLTAAGGLDWGAELSSDGDDEAHALAVGSDGAPTLVGTTGPSTTDHFPTAGADSDTSQNGGTDAFAATLEPDGSALRLSTLVGGSGDDSANAVAVLSGYPFVVGTTTSTDFPTAAPLQGSNGGGYDMFFSAITPSGVLERSTYIGGTGTDLGNGVAIGRFNAAVDYERDVWVTGQTDSGTILTKTGNHGGYSDGVAVRLDSSAPNASTVIFVGGDGGSTGGGDTIARATTDGAGNLLISGLSVSDTDAFAIGATDISNLHPVDGSNGGGGDGYVAKISGASGYAPVWASFVGGSDIELIYGVASDGGSGIYAAGATASNDFTTTAGALQSDRNTGPLDGFVSKFAFAPISLTGPSGIQKTNNATFEFSTTEQGVSLKCRLLPTLPTEQNCATSKAYTNLDDGEYTFGIYAVDSVGTHDPFVERTFKVDTTPPSAPVLTGPADGAKTDTRPTFTWDASSDANGVSNYELEIDGVSQDVGKCNPCSATPASELTAGNHSWRVIAIDQAGNRTPSASRTFLAQSPPSARFSIAPNPALVGRAVTFDGSASADATHTIANYKWDLDGDGSFETDGGGTATTSRTYDSQTTISIGLRVTDSTGLSAESRQDLRVTTQTLTGQFGVSINNGAQYTRTPDVTVTANFPSSITSMLFSNDGGFFAPATFAPARETKWKLDSSGPERLPKIVYVRFLTGPLTSETHTDDIILDETPPTVQTASLLGARTSTVATAAKARTYTLKLKASDSNSGVAGVQITANKRKPGKLLKYKKKLTLKAAAKPKWVRARDRAGNLSRWRKVR
jgi:hypothetical protein